MTLKRKERLFWAVVFGSVFGVGAVIIVAMLALKFYVLSVGGADPRIESLIACLWLWVTIIIGTKAFHYYDREIYHAVRD